MTSVQDPLGLDESRTVSSASSVAGWCFALAAVLVAVLAVSS